MTRNVDNSQDILDSRDIIKRIEELRDERETLQNDVEESNAKLCETSIEEYADALDVARAALEEWTEEYGDELAALEALAEEARGYSEDWEYGVTLIRDSYFKEYAQELAEDIGAINRDAVWPNTCIDWDQAAEALQMDYALIEFDGVTYWVR